jgi:ATP-dependent DNA helicase RecQ
MDSTSLHLSLKANFGFDCFRKGQQEVVEKILTGRSSLAIFPTGSGKSLCYQFSAIHLPHLTLVVSPLLALIKDQLGYLQSKGIPAASIDSSLTYQQNQEVMRGVRSGETKILMVSVERFKNERFRSFIETMPLSLLVIDEAHCISEWGHNFRPDYLKLPQYQRLLNIPQALLLTATATKQVKIDMAERFSITQQDIVQTGFYRANLDLAVQACDETQKAAELIRLIQHNNGAGIVYVTLQKTADFVANILKQANIAAKSYHAGLDTLTRESIQQQFMQDSTTREHSKLQVVVATIAFGMGVDKSDIRFVIHYDLPKSIENYSQEVGRAGRDGKQSNSVILANLDGITTLENFVYGDTPDESAITRLLNDIKQENQQSEWELQHVSMSNHTNIRQLPLKTLLVQLEIMGVITPMYSYFADFKFKLNQPVEQILARFDANRQAFLKVIFDYSPVKKVWASLDMEALQKAFPCERKRVVAALDYLHEHHLIELESKRNTEVFKVNEEALNRLELAQTLARYFKQKERKEIARINALVTFFQTDKCLSRRLSEHFDDQQVPQNCGHCSVCRGNVAALISSGKPLNIDEEVVAEAMAALANRLQEKLGVAADIDTHCRFFAGISSPFLTRIRAKSLTGYNICADMRYAEIRSLVEKITVQSDVSPN